MVEDAVIAEYEKVAGTDALEVSMSSSLHKGHSIIYEAALDKFTGKYAPAGQLLWHGVKGKHGTHSFTLSELFSTAVLFFFYSATILMSIMYPLDEAMLASDGCRVLGP